MAGRRKTQKRKGASRKNTAASVNRWPTFIGGILVGVLLTTGGMYIYASGIKMNLGAGIKNLINNRGGNTEKVVSKDIKAANDPKPVFDFYTVLPEYETVVDEKQFIHDVKKPARPQEKDSTYILQAASYSSFKDADKLKAKLALNGLSSRIEKISVEGKGQFYRVRLGPYSSTATKKDVVKRLGALGIKPLHLKVENKD
jgi:cell division protein FtsN